MDLDKLKSNWNSLDEKEQESSIRDEKITALLKSRGKGTINNLRKWATFEFAGGVVFLIIVPFILFTVELNQLFELIMYILAVFTILVLPWEYFKIQTLRKIDIVNQNLLEVSKSVAFFRKIISYEIIFGVLFLIALDTVIFYMFTTQIQSIILCIVIQGVITVLLYRLMYLNGIKKVREIIAEIEVFENN